MEEEKKDYLDFQEWQIMAIEKAVKRAKSKNYSAPHRQDQ